MAVTIVQIVLFLGVLGVAGFFVVKRVGFIRRNILLGKKIGPVSDTGERWKRTILIAFGQKKMFDKPFVGFMHFLIYAGFLIINVEVLEIILDGITGQHRLFSSFLGSSYGFFISAFEILALGVVISCVVFLMRRNVTKVERFQKPEMKGWPTLDANTILVWEIILMGFLYTMNATDSVLQGREGDYVQSHYPAVGSFAISGLFIPFFEGLSTSVLIGLERGAWWLHIIGILSFAVYVTYSKHLHIGLAFPNVFYSGLKPKGEMENMDAVTNEVKIMLGMAQDAGAAPPAEIGTFGAKDVKDLSWKNLMDSYSCTECGRCTQACPANQTGKKLSPRKVMMDTRDRLEEYGAAIDKNGKDHDDGKSLYGDYTTKEELMACTTCNACVEACPVGINPLDIILQQRRYVAMEESGTPASWNAMFQNLENNQAPWAFPPTDRFNWATEQE